jgi:hypothetical protein
MFGVGDHILLGSNLLGGCMILGSVSLLVGTREYFSSQIHGSTQGRQGMEGSHIVSLQGGQRPC